MKRFVPPFKEIKKTVCQTLIQKISVIVPTFNVEAYIGECLSSILEQTFQDIEIIVVDDHSEDATLTIIHKHYSGHHKIVFIQNRKNEGVSYTRNRGLKEAKGEYIFFIDSDDVLFSREALKNLYLAAKTDDADEVIGKMLHWLPDENCFEEGYFYHLQRHRTFHNKTLKECPSLLSQVIVNNKLIRRKLLIDNNIIFDE